MSSNWASSWLAWKIGFFVNSSPRMHLWQEARLKKIIMMLKKEHEVSKLEWILVELLPAAPHVNSRRVPLFSQK